MSPSKSSFFLSASALKSSNTRVELGIRQLEAEFLDALAQRGAAAVLAEHEVGARHADVVRAHDLVGRVMLQHAVLVDAGLVRERVFADDRLVARNRHAGDAREQAARREQALRVDAGVQAEDALAHLERHHDFFERAVARALADAVDRAFDLARARRAPRPGCWRRPCRGRCGNAR